MFKGKFLFIVVIGAVIALAACSPSSSSGYPQPGGTLPAGTFPAGTEPAGTLPAETQAPVGETPTEAGTVSATQPAVTETQAAPTMPAVTETQAATQPAATETTVAGTPEASGTTGIPVTGAVDPGRASQLLGMEVKDKTGASLGKVDDLLIDLKSGAIYVVISATGSTSGNLIPVPLEVLSFDATNSALSLSVDTATFTGAPGFSSDAYPSTQQSGWDSQFSSYWQQYVPTKAP